MNDSLEVGNGDVLPLDEYGHLRNRDDWSPVVADRMAEQDGIELSYQHWLVIEILREYFDEFGIESPMRVLVSRLKMRGSGAWANSRALYQLFPEGPVRQGSRYGGLPIPLSCI
ncbi:MAG: TusE/DsrC/DsvC family sulfur relay protein [Gammaproteobacteria bacterium]|nr:TusE/DsrC/DsvC family sulfur relay protein [Gammaproteobacteria bacterium]